MVLPEFSLVLIVKGAWDPQFQRVRSSFSLGHSHSTFFLNFSPVNSLYYEFFCLYDIQRIIHGHVQIWNFSSGVQLDILFVHCTHSRDIKLNMRREIPYLQTIIPVSFCLLCKHTNDNIIDDFPKIFQNCSECKILDFATGIQFCSNILLMSH